MNTRNRLWGIITGIIIYISFAINANAQWQKIAKSVDKATCKQKWTTTINANMIRSLPEVEKHSRNPSRQTIVLKNQRRINNVEKTKNMNSITSPKRPKKDFIIATSKSIKKIRKQNINVVNIKKE